MKYLKRNKVLMQAIVLIWTMLIVLFSNATGESVQAAVQLDSQTIVDYVNGRVGEYYPNGYCLSFVEECYQNLGTYRPYNCCAYKSGSNYIVSTRSDNIPKGATVYFGKCGGGPCGACGAAYFGHVGIYIGNGYFVHATGGSVQCTLLASWSSKYRGWGHCGNFTLNTDNYPQGSFDGVSGGMGTVTVSGWAFDRDDLSRSINIHVYVGGPAGSGAPCYSIKANKERADVESAYPGVGRYHGYFETISTDRTGRQEIYVYAINEENGNYNILLGHKTATISVMQRPQMKVWFSDKVMGEQPDSYRLGTTYYLCYELIDGNTGKRLNETENMDITVTETIYKPNGNVAYTYSYNNSNNWIGYNPGEPGTYKGTVTVSGDLNGELTTSFTISSHTHSYVGKVTKAATCVSTGIKTYTCSCGKSYTEKIAKTAHQHIQVKNVLKATCLQNGYTGDMYCNDCNTMIKTGAITEKIDHIIVKDDAIASTCTQVGKTEGSHCMVCGTVIKAQQMIAETGHTWDMGKVKSEATATENGILIYTCMMCKVTKEVAITVTGQEIEADKNIPADTSNSDWVDVDAEVELEEEVLVEIGDVVFDIDGEAEYEVIEISGEVVSVEYTEPINKKAKIVKIPDTIEIEDGIECNVISVASKAFRNNKYVEKIIVGNNVTSIGAKAFYGCKNLVSIALGDSVTTIGANAFSNCSRIIKLVIPSKVSKIGSAAFSGCKNMEILLVESKKLKANGVSGKAFKNLPTDVKIQVPEGKAKTYKKLFRQKGLNTKAKITEK